METGLRCTESEVAELVAHLRTDPNAAGYVRWILDRVLTPWCEIVKSRPALGALSTLFETLGSGSGELRAARLTRRPRFLVREAHAFWRDSAGDEASFRLLEAYMNDARAGRLRNRTITLLDDANGIWIVDGNKRAVAIYETTNGRDDLTLPVFVLRATAR